LQKVYSAVAELVRSAVSEGLIASGDTVWARNSLLRLLEFDSYENTEPLEAPLEEILAVLLDYAVSRGIIADTATARDLFDTSLMGVLTPKPSEVNTRFRELFVASPEVATDWFYTLAQKSDYIRAYRVARDEKWTYEGKYGTLEITINLSKPEKDPKEIAAMGKLKPSGYPKCMLCVENEGYFGRADHPARQNLRILPFELDGERWGFQYSPYSYYNEHCIILNSAHVPMKIDGACFSKLLGFVEKFPHYFAGSNADLPIVGGSILSHEHFQGGRHIFPMERAREGERLSFGGYPDIEAHTLHWPLSVLRIRGAEKARLCALAEKILSAWRVYSDADVGVFAESGGVPHNTITPIARMRGGLFELDLVLRNNRTSDEHPLGIFHPHAELHHIKRENIGLIEVMGLAVLPSRLKKELSTLEKAIISGDLSLPEIAHHRPWAEEILVRKNVTAENINEILRTETAIVFEKCLEHAGVFDTSEGGSKYFSRFIEFVNQF